MKKRQKRPPSALLKVVRTEVFRQRVVADKTRYRRQQKHRGADCFTQHIAIVQCAA